MTWVIVILVWLAGVWFFGYLRDTERKNGKLEERQNKLDELWEYKQDAEMYKREYEHDEELIQTLAEENEQLKKKVKELEGKKHNSKPKKVKKD